MGTPVGHVELLVHGRIVGTATFDFNRQCLWSEVDLRKPPSPKRNESECDHSEPIDAWAVLTGGTKTDFHWPIRYCPECRVILEGAELRPSIDAPIDTHIVWDAWRKRWFKKGRPRRGIPPDEVAWPHAA